jgi:hypothetical protein
VERSLPGKETVMIRFVQTHIEHVTGQAAVSGIAVDESALAHSIPGVNGPALLTFGGKVHSKIFAQIGV